MLSCEVNTAMHIHLTELECVWEAYRECKEAMCSPDVWLYVVICR